MKKIFRMGYEPCKGDCYAYDDVLPLSDLRPMQRERIIKKLLEMHAPMCGNTALRYGVDFDEQRRLFVGFFYHYGAIEVFLDTEMLDCVEQIANCALEHFKSEQYKSESAGREGLGRSACAYGTDDTLVDFIKRTARPLHTA